MSVLKRKLLFVLNSYLDRVRQFAKPSFPKPAPFSLPMRKQRLGETDSPTPGLPREVRPWQTGLFCVLSRYVYTGTQQGRKGAHFTAKVGEARVEELCLALPWSGAAS